MEGIGSKSGKGTIDLCCYIWNLLIGRLSYSSYHVSNPLNKDFVGMVTVCDVLEAKLGCGHQEVKQEFHMDPLPLQHPSNLPVPEQAM